MTVAGDDDMRRAIARTLTEAIRATLPPDAPAKSFVAARDAAQVLGLNGLDRAIRACAEHAGRSRPPDVVALVDRLTRLTEECDTSADVAVFERLDAELVAMAEEIAAYEWDVTTGPTEDESAAIPTLTVRQVLEDVIVQGDDSRRMAERLRLNATVAATLRASLDWLMLASGARRVKIHGEPSLVEIRLESVNPGGLGPAHRVLSAVGGNLGPAVDPEGPEGGWVIRVPSFAAKPTYLMVMQGGIPLALPWHSVLRLRMTGASDGGRGEVRGPDYPMLETFATPASQTPEYPLVLVGHGLKRAWLIADRLIWRLMADPCENPGPPPAAGLSEAVRTDEGDTYWRAEPERLLRRVDVPPPPARRAAPAEAAPATTAAPTAPSQNAELPPGVKSFEPNAVVAESTPAQPVAAPERAAAPTITSAEPPASRDAAPAATMLDTTQVQPLNAPPAHDELPSTVATVQMPQAAVQPALVAPAKAAPASARVKAVIDAHAEEHPHALVAEDSLTGRIFLTRLLEQVGFTTDSVGSAAELFARMADHPWAIVLVDVDLPDDHGPAWIARVRDRAGDTNVVALVRDGVEAKMAHDAGVVETLEKPFDRTSLVALLVRLGFAKTGS